MQGVPAGALRLGVLGADRIAREFVAELTSTGAGKILGVASRYHTAEPDELWGGHLTQSGSDDWAVASLVFAGGFSAQVRTGTRLGDTSDAVIYGSEGYVRVANPWTPGMGGSTPELVVSRVGGDAPETIPCAAEPLFGAEVATLAEAVEIGEARLMTPRDSVATMRTLDRWRAAVDAAHEDAGSRAAAAPSASPSAAPAAPRRAVAPVPGATGPAQRPFGQGNQT